MGVIAKNKKGVQFYWTTVFSNYLFNIYIQDLEYKT